MTDSLIATLHSLLPQRANGYRGRGEGSGLGDARGGVLHEKLDAERRMFPKTVCKVSHTSRGRREMACDAHVAISVSDDL
jgi:hypothetical protein